MLPGEELRRLAPVAQHLRLLRGDLTAPTELQASLATFRPEACIHLAWYAEPGKYLHAPQNLKLLQGSLDLFQTLIELGCSQVIGAGTCAEYETNRGWLREDDSTRPETLYAASKLSLYLCGEQLATQSGMTFAWGRIFYPYGPQEDPRRMVPALIRALLAGETFPASTGEQVRDYIHVEDVATAFLTLLQQRATGIYNIGSGEPTRVRGLMETVAQIIEERSTDAIQFGAMPPRKWEPPFICADNRKLQALGWRARYDLRSGLNATVEWCRHEMRQAK